MPRITKFPYFLLTNFFLVVCILRLLDFLNIEIYLLNIFILSCTIWGGVLCIKNKRNAFDFLVIAYIIYLTLNAVLSDYPHKDILLYRAFLAQYVFIFFYFIGRFSIVTPRNVIKNMRYPLLFCMIAGVIFFFSMPSWYVSMKQELLAENATETVYYEIFRLSSFWGHPYILGYAVLIYSIYLMNDLFIIKNKQNRKVNIIFLLFCAFILLLAQLRVTIVCFLVFFIYILTIGGYLNLRKLLNVFFVILISIFLLYFFAKNMEIGSVEYITEHMIKLTSENALSDRLNFTSGGVDLTSMFGEGLGRYDLPARRFNMFSLCDSEYQNHIAELGWCGFALLLLLLTLSLIKCLFHKTTHIIEFCVISFFALNMIGASSLSNTHQYAYIFWYCLGFAWNNKTKIIK